MNATGRLNKRLFVCLAVIAMPLVSQMGTANAQPVSYTFTDTDEHLIATFSTSFFSDNQRFKITNDSGVKWKRVRLRLEADETFGTYLFPRFIDLAGGGIYYGRGRATFHDWNGDDYGYNEVMKVVVAVQHGHLHRFTADIEAGVYPEGMTELRIYAKPTAD